VEAVGVVAEAAEEDAAAEAVAAVAAATRLPTLTSPLTGEAPNTGPLLILRSFPSDHHQFLTHHASLRIIPSSQQGS
jgi:hypothetical protein